VGRKEEKLADCVDLMRKLYTPLDSIHGAGPARPPVPNTCLPKRTRVTGLSAARSNMR